MNIRPCSWLASLAAAVFALALVGSPALAHKGHNAAAPAPTQSQTANGQAAAPMGAGSTESMPSMEMSWPTEGGGMNMGMGMDKPKPTTFTGRLVAWLGAWHPAVIHFPIALTLVVAFLEIAAVVRNKPVYNAGNKLLLALATLGAFAAAPLGWMDAGWPTPKDELVLTLHRWTGTLVPFLLLALWWLKRPAEAAAVRPSTRAYEALLAVAVLTILAQAYMGGDITHGAGHLAF